jgi:hypothetical protein
MNTTTESTAPVKTQRGAWLPLDDRLFKKRIERMADLACHIDFTKHCLPDQEIRAKIAEAVALVHTACMHYDEINGWDIYTKEGIEATEVPV